MVVGVGGGGGTCEWGEGEGQSGDETLLCLDTPRLFPTWPLHLSWKIQLNPG